MARIIYGVSGEGSGHSSRAREMLTHLRDRGHAVRVLSYGKGYRNLRRDFDVFQVFGLHIASRDNRVSVIDTLRDNLRGLPDGRDSLRQTRAFFEAFRPDCVITDFEPMSAYLASHYGLPLITIDNQHRIRYLRYPRPEGFRTEELLTKSVIKAMVPRPWVSLITTFYFGELRNERSFLFPPILRGEVLAREPSEGEHVLVYVTAEFASLLKLLPAFSAERFRVYGYDKDEAAGNLQYRPFSTAGVEKVKIGPRSWWNPEITESALSKTKLVKKRYLPEIDARRTHIFDGVQLLVSSIMSARDVGASRSETAQQ